MTLQSGVVQLVIPPGAVSTNQTFSATPVTDTVGDPDVIAGRTYRFEPSGVTFAQPVEMRMRYDGATLPAGASPKSLQLRKLVNGAWQAVATDLRVDSANGTVIGKVTGFSDWSLYSNPCEPKDGRLPWPLQGTLHKDSCSLGDLGVGILSTLAIPVTTAAYTVSMEPGTSDEVRYGIGASVSPFESRNVAAQRTQTATSRQPLKAILPGGLYHLWAVRTDLTKKTTNVSALVSYDTSTFSRNQATTGAGCSHLLYMLRGGSTSAAITTADCAFQVQFTTVPGALGKDILADVYSFYLPAGATISAEAWLPAPPPGAPGYRGEDFALTAYTSTMLAQQLGRSEGKTITVPAAGTNRVVSIEVSHLRDGLPGGGFSYNIRFF